MLTIATTNMIASTTHEWHAHAQGCRDLRTPRYRMSTFFPAESVEEFIDPELQRLGWSTDDVKIYACVGKGTR